jgi:hypothetical protein
MRSAVLLAFTGLVASGINVFAHHSYAQFNNQTTSIEGTLVSVVFANPHTSLTIRAADGTLYTATWNAAVPLLSHGVKKTDLKAGDVLAITGFPHRDPATHELAKLREVRRLSDGWAWKDENGRQFVTATH